MEEVNGLVASKKPKGYYTLKTAVSQKMDKVKNSTFLSLDLWAIGIEGTVSFKVVRTTQFCKLAKKVLLTGHFWVRFSIVSRKKALYKKNR